MRYENVMLFNEQLKKEETGTKDYIISANQFVYEPENMTDWAHEQLAEKLKIPVAYYNRMRKESQQVLLMQNVYTWLQQDKRMFLIRTVDNRVRAVLSDHYKPISNSLVRNTIAGTLHNTRSSYLVLRSWLTEKGMYLTIISPHKYEVSEGDTVSAGIQVRNSEVGAYKLSVRPFMYRYACENGVVIEGEDVGGFEQVHLGKPIRAHGAVDFSERTEELAIGRVVRALNDIVVQTFDPALFETLLAKVRESKQVQVSDRVQAVHILTQQLKLSGWLERILLSKFEEATQYGLANAVTAFAKVFGREEVQYNFEALGGRIMLMTADEFREAYQKEERK